MSPRLRIGVIVGLAALPARAGELTALVSLYKALGGGWQDTAGPPTAGPR